MERPSVPEDFLRGLQWLELETPLDCEVGLFGTEPSCTCANEIQLLKGYANDGDAHEKEALGCFKVVFFCSLTVV